MRGKPILLMNCDQHIDNVITPLIHHRNTAEENDKEEGNISFTHKLTVKCMSLECVLNFDIDACILNNIFK